MGFDGSNKVDVGCAQDIDYAAATSAAFEIVKNRQMSLATPEALAWYQSFQNDKPLKVVDAASLSEEEWQKMRKDSIGSSAAGQVFGLCPYKDCTNLDLYYDKTNQSPAIQYSEQEEKQRQRMFKFGHLMEDYLRFVLEQDNPGCRVIVDTWVYADPNNPFLTANLDGMMQRTDGTWVHVEYKTTNEFGDEAYENDAIPLHYRAQLIQCQHILNVWESILIVAPTRDKIIKRTYFRDLDLEMEQIMGEVDFWEKNVIPQIPPAPLGPSENVLRTLRRYSGYANGLNVQMLPTVSFEAPAEKIVELTEKKRKLNAEIKLLEEEIRQAQIPFVQAMGRSTHAMVVKSSDKSMAFYIKYAPQKGRRTMDFTRFKNDYPELYNEYVSVPEEGARPFSITLGRVSS